MVSEWPKLEVMGESGIPPGVDQALALTLFRDMTLLRAFDERAINLQRQGRIGTFPPSLGQEASEIGSAHAIRPTDWIVPSYRDHGALHVHGVPWENVLLFAMGRTASLSADVKALPTSIPIATHLPHAVGLAMASQRLGRDDVAIAYFGDGATSEGDFHEALNFAGVFRAPVVFFCQNNGWAISVPRTRQTAAETLAQKAVAYGIAGARVDGNDVLAVYQAVTEAVARARAGEGPTLVEAETYRLGPHTTADDPTRYRPEAEYEDWKTHRDPLIRMAGWLRDKGWISPAEEAEGRAEAEARIAEAVAAAEALPLPAIADMFTHVYHAMPDRLREQVRWIEEVETGDA
jgi:pyruvate dehydrogenase E1 component alpha subunit